jgi:hypothetical protein
VFRRLSNISTEMLLVKSVLAGQLLSEVRRGSYDSLNVMRKMPAGIPEPPRGRVLTLQECLSSGMRYIPWDGM